MTLTDSPGDDWESTPRPVKYTKEYTKSWMYTTGCQIANRKSSRNSQPQ